MDVKNSNNIKMLLNIAHEEKGRATNVGSSSKWLLGIFQDGGPLIPRPSLFSKMVTKSNFSSSQGIVVDVKIRTRVELHKVKFLWVTRTPPPNPGANHWRVHKLINLLQVSFNYWFCNIACGLERRETTHHLRLVSIWSLRSLRLLAKTFSNRCDYVETTF